MYRPRTQPVNQLGIETIVEKLMRVEFERYDSVGNVKLAQEKAIAADAGIVAGKVGVDIAKVRKFLKDEVLPSFQYTAAVSEALQNAKARHPEYNFDFRGADQRILDRAESMKFNITSAKDLGDVMQWMIETGPPDNYDKIELSSYGQRVDAERKQRQQAEATRKKLLDDIMQDRKTSYPQWDAARGKFVFVPADFDSLSTDDLLVIQQHVIQYRRATGASVENQRERLHKFANTQREGYLPDGTKVSGFDNRERGNVIDKAEKVYDQPAEAIVGRQEASADPFINPLTAHEFTRTEVMALARNNYSQFKILMQRDGSRLNRLLSSK
jgi:hypothetical protein